MSLAEFSKQPQDFAPVEVYKRGDTVIEITKPDHNGNHLIALNGVIVPNWELRYDPNFQECDNVGRSGINPNLPVKPLYLIKLSNNRNVSYGFYSLDPLIDNLNFIFRSMALAAGYDRFSNNPKNHEGKEFSTTYRYTTYRPRITRQADDDGDGDVDSHLNTDDGD